MQSPSADASAVGGQGIGRGPSPSPPPPPTDAPLAPVTAGVSGYRNWCELVVQFRKRANLMALLDCHRDLSQPLEESGEDRFSDELRDLLNLFGGKPERKDPSTSAGEGELTERPYRTVDKKLSSMAAVSIAQQLRPKTLKLAALNRSKKGKVPRYISAVKRMPLMSDLSLLGLHTQAIVARHLFVRILVDSIVIPDDRTFQEQDSDEEFTDDPSFDLPSIGVSLLRSACNRHPQLFEDVMADMLGHFEQSGSSTSTSLTHREANRYEGVLSRAMLSRIRRRRPNVSSSMQGTARFCFTYYPSPRLVELAIRKRDEDTRTPSERFRSSVEGKALCDLVGTGWGRAKRSDATGRKHEEVLNDVRAFANNLSCKVLSEFGSAVFHNVPNLPSMDEDLDRDDEEYEWEQEWRENEELKFYSRPQEFGPESLSGQHWLEGFTLTTAAMVLRLWQADSVEVGSTAKQTRMVLTRLALDAGMLTLAIMVCKWIHTQSDFSPGLIERAYIDADPVNRRAREDSQRQQLFNEMRTRCTEQLSADLVGMLQQLQRHLLRASRTERQAEVPLKSTLNSTPFKQLPIRDRQDDSFKRLSMLRIAFAQHVAGIYTNETRALELASTLSAWPDQMGFNLGLNDVQLEAAIIEAHARAERLAVEELQLAEREAEERLPQPAHATSIDAGAASGSRASGQVGVHVAMDHRTPASKVRRSWAYDEVMDTWVLITPSIVRLDPPRETCQGPAAFEVEGPHTAEVESSSIYDETSSDDVDNEESPDAASGWNSRPTFDLLRSLRKDHTGAAGARGIAAERCNLPRQRVAGARCASSSPVARHGRPGRPMMVDEEDDIATSDDQDDEDELDLFQARTPPPKRAPMPVQRFDIGREDDIRRELLAKQQMSDEGGIASTLLRPLLFATGTRPFERSLSLGEMPMMDRSIRPRRRRRRRPLSNMTASLDTATGSVGTLEPRRPRRTPRETRSDAEDDEDFEPDTDAQNSDIQSSDSGSEVSYSDDGSGAGRDRVRSRPYQLRSRSVRPAQDDDDDDAPPPWSKKRRAELGDRSTSIEVVIPAPSSSSRSSRRFPVLDL